MECLQNRIDSFKKSRRVKNPSKPSSSVSVKWPHPPYPKFLATPETLAEAGFYYDPSFEDRDSVTCFVCDKQLSDWEAGDDPFDIHWSKCGDRCCWAIVRCGLKGDINAQGGYTFSDKSRFPTSKDMERARFETFSMGDGWKHGENKNHGANSRKMARAGFVYTPNEVGDDLATCLYCNLALNGWISTDDPMAEHRKRQQEQQGPCPLFDASEPSAVLPSRAQSAKPSSKLPPSKQSRSVSSSHHSDFVQPLKTYDGDTDQSDAPTNRRSTRTASSLNKSTRASKVARSRSRSELKNVAEDDEDGNVAEDVAPRTGRSKAKKSLAGTTKKARSRSKSVAPVAASDEEEGQEEEVVPTRSRSKAKGKGKAVVEDDHEAEEVTMYKSTRRRTTAQAKPQVKTEDEPATTVLKKSTRGRAPPPVEDDDDNVTPTAKKPTRAKLPSRTEVPRKTSRIRVKEPEPEPESESEEVVDDVDEEEEEERKARVPPKSRAKTPASRKPSRAQPRAAPVPAEEADDEEIVSPPTPVEEKKLTTSTHVKGGSKLSRKPSAAAKSNTVASGKSIPVSSHDEENLEDQPDEPLHPKLGAKKPTSSSTASTKLKATQKQAKLKALPAAISHSESTDAVDEINVLEELLPQPLSTTSGASKQPSKAKPKISTASRPPEETGEDIDVVPPPRQDAVTRKPSLPQSSKARPEKETEEELQPLVIPKRSVKPSKPSSQHAMKPVDVDIAERETEEEMELLVVPKRGVKPSKPSSQPAIKLVDVDIDAGMEPAAPSRKTVAKAGKPRLVEKEKPPKEADVISSTKGRKGSILKVVEISTDEEGGDDDEKSTQETIPQRDPRSVAEVSASHSDEIPVEISRKTFEQLLADPPEPSRTPIPSRHSVPTHVEKLPKDDIDMTVEPEPETPVETQVAEQVVDEASAPQTPPRTAAPTVVPVLDPLPLPALSKVPFIHLQNLTDAELDMTVEEWIRYQMEAEYDKFRRDGEREIGRFRKRAEEVRSIIEGL